MKTVLVTGFAPFGGETINPSWIAVEQLPNNIDNATIVKARIDTEFGTSFEQLLDLIAKVNPQAILCVGQAGGRKGVTVEKIAINYAQTRNYGRAGVIIDNTIVKNGADGYFATLPTQSIVDDINATDIPCALSLSAGSFVCNYIMYSTLHYCQSNQLPIMAGFIHLPYCQEQLEGKPDNTPYLPIKQSASAILTAVKTIAKNLHD